MPAHSNRPRRAASPKQIRALRVLGWRFSTTREAWVHRSFGGRVGPVFRDPHTADDHGELDLRLFETMVAQRQPKVVVAPHERTVLPQRSVSVPRPVTAVRVRLHAAEEPRVVMVDGRPPRRGFDPRSLRIGNAVVVPIKSSRATA